MRIESPLIEHPTYKEKINPNGSVVGIITGKVNGVTVKDKFELQNLSIYTVDKRKEQLFNHFYEYAEFLLKKSK